MLLIFGTYLVDQPTFTMVASILIVPQSKTILILKIRLGTTLFNQTN